MGLDCQLVESSSPEPEMAATEMLEVVWAGPDSQSLE